MARSFSTAEVIGKLARLCEKEGSQKAAAQKLQVSEKYISAVLRGSAEPGPKILRPMGLRRVIAYVYEKAA